jgi:hypothetical protein
MPPKPSKPTATLTLRELNRATLARQMLLEREAIGPVEAIERLAGLQAQYSPSPYIALWTRLDGFQHEHLTNALHQRTVIKGSLMRWTLHLLSARDYPFFIPIITESRTQGWRSIAAQAGLDVPKLHKSLLDYAEEPRTQEEMISFLDAQVPGNGFDRRILWHSASSLGGLVHTPPSGTWRYFGKNPYIAVRQWLGDIETPPLPTALAYTVRRYLAAFGPATRADVVQWAGLRKISHVDTALEALGDEVITFSGEGRGVLYDLASAPRPSGDTPAPPRFLAKWDNLLLSHEDRERVLPARYRKTVIKINGDVIPTFLVDGVVAGVWSPARNRATATLTIEPFEAIDQPARTALEEEGARLIRFVEPDAETYEIKFVA